MKLSLKRSEIPQHLLRYFTAPAAKYKNGDLVNIPFMVAEALQADGWVLRQDIIWQKPGPMPESVTNRCTKAHEYLFLLTKGMDYYCDMEAVKEVSEEGSGWARERAKGIETWKYNDTEERIKATGQTIEGSTHGTSGSRNKRSVWTVSSQGYPGAHFATYPPKLIEPCILAGTSAYGACKECGKPWQRVVENRGPVGGRQHDRKDGSPHRQEGIDAGGSGANWDIRTVGWKQACACDTEEVRPCIVLDPFIGSGTTCEVCIEHGRWSWGIDLSEQYLKANAIPRVEGALLSRPALVHLVRRERVAVKLSGRSVRG